MTLRWWDAARLAGGVGGYFLVFSQVVRNHWPVIWPCTPPAKSCIPQSSLLPLIHIYFSIDIFMSNRGWYWGSDFNINKPTADVMAPESNCRSEHRQFLSLQFMASLKFWIHNFTRLFPPPSIKLISGEILHLHLLLSSWWRWTHLRSRGCRESWSYDATVKQWSPPS